MINKQKTITTLIATITCLLAGCAAQMNPVGEAKFDCNRRQDSRSPHCRSFKSVDASTNGELPNSRFDKEFKVSDLDRLNGIDPDDAVVDKNKTPPIKIARPHQRRNEPPLAGSPVREGPVIQRVWIKRFVDGRDLLTENTVVYKEIKGTKWAGFDSIGTKNMVNTNTYPRRPAEVTPTAIGGIREQRQTPAPEFSQPGHPESAEPALDPSVNGSSTMPK
jgi:conjugal transfer pilus assembly protein TraV